MARSVRSSPNAFVAEVARYLAVDPDDVQAMIHGAAKLPHFKIPKKTRHVYRIPLRELHAWLRARSGRTAFADYETFLADFDASARTKTAA
jgi:hypothetical protein